MRFVLGVLMGAAVVLWLSGLANDPRRLVAELRAGALEAVEEFTAVDTPDTVHTASAAGTAGTGAGGRAGALPAAAAPTRQLQALPEREPTPLPAPDQTPDQAPDRTPDRAPDQAPDQALAQRPDPPSQSRFAEPQQVLAAVWTPFHSERSARGFAGRLSRALDHPFRVRRQGPGTYQVVFAYDDPSQRDALLTQVATLTGDQP